MCVAQCNLGEPCHGACPSSSGGTCWTETQLASNPDIRAKLAAQGYAVSWTQDGGADDALWFAEVGFNPQPAQMAGLCNGDPASPIGMPRGSIGTEVYCESPRGAATHAVVRYDSPGSWSQSVVARLGDGGVRGDRLDVDVTVAWFFLDDSSTPRNLAQTTSSAFVVEDFGAGPPRTISSNYEGAAIPEKIAYPFVNDAGVPVLRWKKVYQGTSIQGTYDEPRAGDITLVRTNAGPEYLTGVGGTDAGLVFRREPDNWSAEWFGGPASAGATFDLLTKYDDTNYVAWSNDAGVWLSTRTPAGLWYTERVSARPADQVRVSSFGGAVSAVKAGQAVWICK